MRWSEHTQPVNATGNGQVPDVPDSHDKRLMRVRAAMRRDSRPPEVRRAAKVVRSLAERVGQADLQAGVPRAIRRQQWSVFNILLMWTAATGDRSCPVLQWLAQSAQHLSIPVCGVEMPGHGGDGRLGSMSWAFHPSMGCQSEFQAKGSHNHDGEPISVGVSKDDS